MRREGARVKCIEGDKRRGCEVLRVRCGKGRRLTDNRTTGGKRNVSSFLPSPRRQTQQAPIFLPPSINTDIANVVMGNVEDGAASIGGYFCSSYSFPHFPPPPPHWTSALYPFHQNPPLLQLLSPLPLPSSAVSSTVGDNPMKTIADTPALNFTQFINKNIGDGVWLSSACFGVSIKFQKPVCCC